MEFNGKVYRWRRKPAANGYNPNRPTFGPWSEADVVVLEGAAVLSSSNHALRTADRDQALTAKSLFLDEAPGPGTDVRRGDGISLSPGGDEPEFMVEVVPAVDVNPFTGDVLAVEIPLTGATG